MANLFTVTHYYHSGFSVGNGDTLLVFDYWTGEEGELEEEVQLKPEEIRKFANVVVFISHEHMDHLDPIVYTWKDLTNVVYIVSSDMPVGTRGKRMAPGDTFTPVPDVNITAFDSTDLGVSFLVAFRGLTFFHAGDLNFWHWREESTMQEIEEADQEFRKAVRPLCEQAIDIAFFPVDPRQGAMFEAGANYFILAVKPRILIPMHYFHRGDIAVEYARTASGRSTEVIAMPLYGQAITVEEDDEGYLNIDFPQRLRSNTGEAETEDSGSAISGREDAAPGAPEAARESFDILLDENDPFAESDLPVSLSDDEENGNA